MILDGRIHPARIEEVVGKVAEEIDDVILRTGNEAVMKLPEIYRAVMTLRDIEELSTEETADVLDISVEAVKTRLHRARLVVRQELDEYMRGAKAGGRR